jgi:hypothetical protein
MDAFGRVRRPTLQGIPKEILPMNSERAQAYGTAVQTLRDLQPSKFTSEQMELFVECADALLFADDDASVAAAGELYERAAAELDAIAEADRLMPETAERLKGELSAIGAPAAPAAACA